MTTNDFVIDHLARVLGRGVRMPRVLQATDAMGIIAVDDPDLDAVHVASLGMATQDVSSLHPSEFVCSVRPAQEEAARYLVETALEAAAAGGVLTLDSVMDNGSPLLTGTDICGMLLSPGLWFPDLDVVEDASGQILLHVITLLPLTSQDIAFLDTHDADDFYARIEGTQADLLDITRDGLL